jgi:hypothetical protein
VTAVDVRPARARLGARIVIAVAFLLAFGWQIFGAVSNLLAWIRLAVLAGGQLTATAWVVLILGIAIPTVVYVVALVFARRRSPLPLALILVLALCVSEALSLAQLAFFLSVVGSLTSA